MLFFRVCGYCIVLTKMKVMSLSVSSSFPKRCCQCNSFETFKGRQIILEPCMKLKIASDVCYNDTEHYQVESVKNKAGATNSLSLRQALSFCFLLVESYLLPLILKFIQIGNIFNLGSQFRSILRTLPNIRNGDFSKNSGQLLIFDYFCKKLNVKCLARF